jgi:CheY-like chemotaxis protein
VHVVTHPHRAGPPVQIGLAGHDPIGPKEGYPLRTKVPYPYAPTVLVADDDPDLIILDLSMPDTDGIELIRSIRVELPHLRVIAVSGFLNGSFLGIGLKLGASGTLQKPVPEATF